LVKTNQSFKILLQYKTRYKAEIILLLVTLSWGLSFSLIKIALIYISPFAFVFYRFLITTIILFLFFRKRILKIRFYDIKYGLILGVFLFIAYLTQTIGLKYTSASNSAFITGTNIVLIPFVQILIVKTKPKIGNIIGIIFVLIGLYFLIELKDAKLNYGDFITLCCAISVAFYIVLLDRFYKKTGYFEMIYGQFIAMVILSFLGTFFIEYLIYNEYRLVLNFESTLSLILTALLATLIGLYFSTKYQKFTTPVRAGLIYNMEPIFAVIFAYFILHELMSFYQLIGASIMFSGLIISEFFEEFKSYLKK